jgi:chaperonin GroES
MKAETKTSTGIFLPDSAVKELNEGKVLAVGPGLHDKDGKRIPLGVQAGDKVLIPQFGGSPIKVGEEEFTLFRDHEYVARNHSSIKTIEQEERLTFAQAPCQDQRVRRWNDNCTIKMRCYTRHNLGRAVRVELGSKGIPQKMTFVL